MKSGWSVKLFLIVMTVSLLMAVGGAREAQAQLQARPCGPDSVPPVLKVLFWQGSGGADFKPACREHDRCYTKGSGRLKADCDCEFLHNLQAACQCSRNPRRCHRRAKIMYRMTVRFGDAAFGTE